MIDPNLKHFEIALGEKTYELRYSWGAIAWAEERLGFDWTLWNPRSHRHLAVLIAAGIRHAEPDVTPASVSERLDLGQWATVRWLIDDALSFAHTGKTRAEREAEAAAAEAAEAKEEAPGEAEAAG